jgi:hypothetical protein
MEAYQRRTDEEVAGTPVVAHHHDQVGSWFFFF